MEYYAFMNEMGNVSFDFNKQGVSTHFLINAVIVEKSQLYKVRQDLEGLSFEFSGYEELREEGRIAELLTRLEDINLHVYSFVTNKQLLNENRGIGYTDSFVRFLNEQLYKDLFYTFPHLQMITTNNNNNTFLTGFDRFVKGAHIPDLFNQSDFGFIEKTEPLFVGLVNLLTSIIFNRYESGINEKLFQLLKPTIIRLKTWPEKSIGYEAIKNLESEYNEIIVEQSIKLAASFVANFEEDDEPVVKDQVNFVKFLLAHLSFNPEKYVITDEIIHNLCAFSGERMSKHYFRSNVVAPLRDKGLLIASSDKGYKLPISKKDLMDYVNFSSLRIMPMLHRLEKCRNQILHATQEELDIIKDTENKQLQRYFDVW